jgi:lysozyme
MSTLEELAAAFTAPFEAAAGPVLTAYQDIAGVWTIGYGTTHFNGVSIKEDDVWTAAQCMAALAEDVSATIDAIVAANMWHPWNDNEIVAMTSLAYNIGITAFKSSSVLKFHNQGNKLAASQAFLLWDKAHVDGQLVTVNGLLRRRQAEAAKYLS